MGYGLMAPVEKIAPPSPAAPQATAPRRKIASRGAVLPVAALVVLTAGVTVLMVPSRRTPSPPRYEVAWWKLDEAGGRVAADASGSGLSG